MTTTTRPPSATGPLGLVTLPGNPRPGSRTQQLGAADPHLRPALTGVGW